MNKIIEVAKNINGKGIVENFSKYLKNDWNQKAPGIAAFDADGTILNTQGSDQWFTLINQLQEIPKQRILYRVNLLKGSSDTFLQQYLSASSLYEFALNGWDSESLKNLSQSITLRKGVYELFNYLQDKQFKIVIITYGIKSVIEGVLQRAGLNNIEVYANDTWEIAANGSTLIDNYLPEYSSIPSRENTNKDFLNFVDQIGSIPNLKGNILSSVIKENHFENKKIIAVGDSVGDKQMFNASKEMEGISLLHAFTNVDGNNIVESSQLEELINYVTYICINKLDSSFEPTASLIKTII